MPNNAAPSYKTSKVYALKRGRNKIFLISAVLLLVTILLCLFTFKADAHSKVNGSLLQLVVLSRHGARNPTDTYNTDPYKNYNWPNGRGALTNEGKLQMYELGKLLRQHYEDFLPIDYYDKDIYVLSSDNSRCLMSAYTMLTGLYPPSEKQRWHGDIPWQPIPVHALPRLMDDMIAAKKPCAKLDEEYDLARESERIKILDEELQNVYTYLTLHTNGTVDNILALEYLYSVFLVQREQSFKLPNWVNSVFPGKMEIPMRTSLALFTDNDTMKRLRTGPLLKDILKNMRTKEQGEAAKTYLYSAHDITIVSFMRTLGIPDLMRPEYGASFALELHKIGSDEPFVKALYWNNTKTLNPYQIRLPLCDTPCTLDKFEQSMMHLIPEDWEAECENK